MKKLPKWVRPVCDVVVVLLLCRALWVLRDNGLTAVTVAIILVMSLCLTRLSYLVFPRRPKPVVVEQVVITENGPGPVPPPVPADHGEP